MAIFEMFLRILQEKEKFFLFHLLSCFNRTRAFFCAVCVLSVGDQRKRVSIIVVNSAKWTRKPLLVVENYRERVG